jgi:hypothetical protein
MAGARKLPLDLMVREHLRSWLRHAFTGCSFAAHLAAGEKSEPRIGYFVALGPIVQATLDAIETTIDSSAAVGKVAVSIFPTLHTPDETARMIAMLGRRDRWTITRRAPPVGVRLGGIALGLHFKTDASAQSSVLGLAPFGTLPVMRRSPYVCLVAWGGGAGNPYRPGSPSPGSVGLIDIPPQMTRVEHRKTMKRTNERVLELAALPPEPLAFMREVTFILPRAATRRHLGALPTG